MGRVEFDETRVATLRAGCRPSRPGLRRFPGTNVRQGEHLVSIYSPNSFPLRKSSSPHCGPTASRGPRAECPSEPFGRLAAACSSGESPTNKSTPWPNRARPKTTSLSTRARRHGGRKEYPAAST